MKKGILALALALVLALPLSVQAADTDAKDPVVMLTGKLWLESAENEKVAFLYGIDMAIAVEQYIARESDKTIIVIINISPIVKLNVKHKIRTRRKLFNARYHNYSSGGNKVI